jgi:iron uptake system EfeUOB component EfeO/EfeM
VHVRQNHSFPARTFRTCVAGLALVSLISLSACGDDDDDASTTVAAASDESLAPEDIKVAPAVVTAGLTKLPATIASAIASIGTPEAEAKVEAIEAEWASFEGTVRDTDPDIYLAIEDQLDPVQDQIKAGDTEAATATLATMTNLFTQYLTKHPG